MEANLVSPLADSIPYVLKKFEQELCLAADAGKEVGDLEDLTRRVRCFLKKANSMEVIGEELKASIKKMRKILLDSEYIIDDFRRRESNSHRGGPIASSRHHWDLRTFALEAKEIKTILLRYRTTLDPVDAIETKHQLPSDLAQSSSVSDPSLPLSILKENDNELVGIDEARERLVRWLTEDHSIPKVIFVHGAHGVGKTSLVAAVLRHQSLRNYFKCCVWMVEGKASVLKKANAGKWNLTKEHNGVGPKEAFGWMSEDEDLRKDRWVLVLDEINSERVFETLRCHLHPRPSVLVTARDSSLASKIRAFSDSLGSQYGDATEPPKDSFSFGNLLNVLWRGQEPPKRSYRFHDFKPDFLSPDDSFTLFSLNFPEGCHPACFDKDSSDCILKKCEGLPLAVLATKKLLIATKDDVSGTSRSVAWEQLSCKLGQELISRGGTNDLIRRMITLHVDHNVHDCLLYLSVFPLDCPIRCSILMRLWMAERLIEQEQQVQTIEGQTLKGLLDQNLIQEVEQTSYGRVKTCRIHNILHQIIICKSKDYALAMIVADRDKKWPWTIHRLSFHSDMDSTEVGIEAKELCSLLVFKQVHARSMKRLLKRNKKLRVLHLQGYLTKKEEDLYQASLISFTKKIYRLKYLRYLSLRDCNVKELPHGIGDLAFLEILDLKGTPVDELPEDIWKLDKLCHLLAYRSDRSSAAGDPKIGVKAPPTLGRLRSLQKLCMIQLTPKRKILSRMHWSRGQLLTELGNLASLRRLGISKLESRDVRHLCSSIEKLTRLEALHLIANPGERIDLSEEDNRRAPAYLQRVHLTGCFGTLSNWLLSSQSLVKLVLKRSQLDGDPLQQLGELRSLEHLELKQAFDVHEMTFEVGWFPQLHFLGVDTIDNLESIKVEKEALPTLQILSIARCQLLKTVPQDITHPRELKCLELCGMPDEFTADIERKVAVLRRIKVNIKEWKDGALEVVGTLPEQPTASPRAPPPCMK